MTNPTNNLYDITEPGTYATRSGATVIIEQEVWSEASKGNLWRGKVLNSTRSIQHWYPCGSFYPPELRDPHNLDIVSRLQ